MTSERQRGRVREGTAAKDWRNAFLPYGSMGNMTGWYSLERESICRRYADLREDFEMDHATPKIAKDAQGAHKACGLHCWANLVETYSTVNREKHTQFDPDRNRLQRPANRHPGGAFDPEPTAYEWSLIRQSAEGLVWAVDANGGREHYTDDGLGTPEAVSLESLRSALDAKAREYEQHVATVLLAIESTVTS